jgi:ketosteroid isomerase-like protein
VSVGVSVSSEGDPLAESKTADLVAKFVEHLEAQRFEDAYRLLNADGRFILTGQTPASGTYEGLDDIFSRLAPKLAGFTRLPEIKVLDVLVDGDKAFVRAVGSGAGAYGPYEQPHYGYFLRREGSGLSEIIEYLDTVQLETALYGKTLMAPAASSD